ncbi:MAG: DUF819 family protein [Gemmatimonadaceae bacterium]
MTNPVLILFTLAAIVLAALWLEANTRGFRKIGAAATAILLALTLSNVGLIPSQSPVYDFLLGQAVIAGIILILLNVSLGSIRQAGAPMLLAFALGAVGSAAGAMIMARLVSASIGTETWKLSGQFTATYIGGGMNFAAVGQQLQTRSDLFTAGIAADVIITAIWLVACLLVPELFARREVASVPPAAAPSPNDVLPNTAPHGGLAAQLNSSGVPLRLTDFAGLASITLGIMWVADVLTSFAPTIPRIIWLTTLVLVVAQFPVVRKLSGSVVIGNFLLLLFLASNGAKSVVAHIVAVGPAIFWFAAGTVAIHGIIIFGIGYLLRMNGDMLAIASQANIGGATTAMALAGSRRRPELILPGVAVGILGNAIGNYAGIAVAYAMKAGLSTP